MTEEELRHHVLGIIARGLIAAIGAGLLILALVVLLNG